MCNSLRNEVSHLGVDVGTIHPSWIDTDMVREGDETQRSFQRLRDSMKEPFKRTYPLERAVTRHRRPASKPASAASAARASW